MHPHSLDKLMNEQEDSDGKRKGKLVKAFIIEKETVCEDNRMKIKRPEI